MLDYFESIYQHHYSGPAKESEQAEAVRNLLRAREVQLLQPLLDYMDQHPRIRLIGRTQASERAPTVAFTVNGMSPGELSGRLNEAGLGVGTGDFYARRLVEALAIDPDEGVLRASFVHYTSEAELNRFVESLDRFI